MFLSTLCLSPCEHNRRFRTFRHDIHAVMKGHLTNSAQQQQLKGTVMKIKKT